MILSKTIFKQIDSRKIDLLWILVPPNSLVKEVAKYKKRHNKTKIIFDLIDLWPETMPISKFKTLPPFWFWKELRDKYLYIADSIVTECNLYKERLPKTIDQTKVHTIYLAREINDEKIMADLPNDRIALCYVGSINNIIDIETISGVIAQISKIKSVTIHIIGDGEKREQLIKACRLAGGEVVFHGKIYEKKEKQKIFNVCHYGLNLMKESVVVGLTMKSMDYFEGALPLINNIAGDTWEIVLKEGIGYNIDGTENYTDIINYDIRMRDRTRKFYEKEMGSETFKKNVQAVIDEI